MFEMFGTKRSELIYNKILVVILDGGDIYYVDNLSDDSEMPDIREILDYDNLIGCLEDNQYIDQNGYDVVSKSIYTCEIKFEFIEDHYELVEYDMSFKLSNFKKIELEVK